MNRHIRTFAALLSVAAATIAGAMPAGASPGTADGTSCPPVSTAQLHAILGLPSSMQARNTVDDSGPSVDYLCNGVAWSGPTPTSFQAALRTAKAGHGAGFGIESWTPNDGSPNADEWPKAFDKLVATWVQGHILWPGLLTNAGWPSKGLAPPPLGHLAAGIVVRPQGVAKGLVAAAGCWWNRSALSAVCVLVEEASGKPVVKHLNQLASIAVKKVL